VAKKEKKISTNTSINVRLVGTKGPIK
jgi:hypothetical protein